MTFQNNRDDLLCNIMFENYFDNWEVKPEFFKEYVSLWSGWLGKERYHLLDQVTEEEWARFNALILALSKKFSLGLVNCEARKITFPSDITTTFSNYVESMDKDSSMFSQYIIPELECVVTEEWDYTYIIWHKNNGAVEALKPYIDASKLEHFTD